MHALLVSLLVVAVAEIGDKTQLLSLILAARFRQPGPLIAGIFVATVANHALAGWLGVLAAGWIPEAWRPGLLAASFLAVALWTLKPDQVDADDAPAHAPRGVFVATTIAFFLAEMGDKTQVATIALAAQVEPYWQVVAGTTLGMMAANVPVVWLGSRFADRLPLRAARYVAAAGFAGLALWTWFWR